MLMAFYESGIFFTLISFKLHTKFMDIFRKCIKPVERCLSDAKMDKGSVHDEVVVFEAIVKSLFE